MAALMRAMDAREMLAKDGTKLKLVYQWGDPSAPQGVMWIGNKDVLQVDANKLMECGGPVIKELLKAPRC
jgi:hypothetical protein